MGRSYLIFLVIAGFFGAMMGRGGNDASTASTSGSSSAGSSYARDDGDSDGGTRDGESSAPLSDGAVELRRSGDGHFYADVQINGAQVHALVDTGASGIALSRDDARAAGVGLSIGMPNVVGEGADGDVHGEFVKLDSVSLGGKRVEGVNAVVLDSGSVTLLGQSFLSEFARVEIEGDRMILR